MISPKTMTLAKVSNNGTLRHAPVERWSVPMQAVKPWKLPPQRTYLFLGANIVDPVEAIIHFGVNVKISDGLIEYVGNQQFESSRDTIVIDLQGRYICPGLIDCHVHITSVPGEASLGPPSSDIAVSLLRQPFACKQILDRGFTTVRDTGGATLALKEAIEDGVFPGPRCFIANHALSQTGGHGDPRGRHDRGSGGCGCSTAEGLSILADGVPDCIRAAREQLRTGADFIKIMAGGGVASPTDRLTNTQYTAAEIRAICDVAASYGTTVTAHAYTPEAIRHAVDNGVRGIEHGNFLDAPTAVYMAARGVWLTPTLVTYEAMASDEYAVFLPPESRRKNEEVLARGVASLRVAADAGVTMCYGSDLLGPLTREQSREFAIRARVLSGAEVLRSATVNAAKMLGQEAFLGQIKAGFAADLLILNENPLADVSILSEPERHVLAVIKDGRVYTSRWSRLPTDVERAPETIE
ncbi:amidohydrolase [Xylariales sp. PMI_506]|nr:amidohydrolase [Xylariales sp. PMI_506]